MLAVFSGVRIRLSKLETQVFVTVNISHLVCCNLERVKILRLVLYLPFVAETLSLFNKKFCTRVLV